MISHKPQNFRLFLGGYRRRLRRPAFAKATAGRGVAATVIVFCLFHGFAIAVFLLPSNTWTETPKNLVRPYMLLTSQWQQWDIFSPDPLRLVSFYRLETIEESGQPTTLLQMDRAHLAWYESAKELKILGRLEDKWHSLVPTYITSLCDRMPQAAGKTVQLVARSAMLPKDNRQLGDLANWQPEFTEKSLGSARCPSDQ